MASYETCRGVVYCNSYAYDVMESVVNMLMLLPEKMVKEFANNDWHIYITNRSIESHLGERVPAPGEGSIQGITDFQMRVIVIPISEGDDRTFAAAFATIHEFGHYFDRSKGLISLSYEFQKIYNTEDRIFCNNLCTASNTTDSTEYFAESFAQFVHVPEKMKELCPDTYGYFNRFFQNYK